MVCIKRYYGVPRRKRQGSRMRAASVEFGTLQRELIGARDGDEDDRPTLSVHVMLP